MKRKIKLGDKVKILVDKIDSTGEKFIKGTIGIVCDISNPNCPMVELKNSKAQDSWTGFSIYELELIE